MSTLILLAAALLPAILLWCYIWKQDPQPEPTNWLVKAALYGAAICFEDHSPRMAIFVLLIPVLAHGIYDAIALGGIVNPYVGSISTFVLIYFCIKMHKFAKTKIVAHIERDNNSNNV